GEPIPTNNQLAVLPYHRVAARDLLLLGAANPQKTDGSNSSSGGNIGVSLGFGSSGGGLSIFANANKGQGKEHGDGTFWSETQLDSGGTLSLHSGRDTALIGAQASGETVKVDAGRDLLLQSLQDSDNYDSKQSSISGGVSVAQLIAGLKSDIAPQTAHRAANIRQGLRLIGGFLTVTAHRNTNAAGAHQARFFLLEQVRFALAFPRSAA
uniref:hemagglutinin repeat-containing protein n=2 Tax=Yersinia bercovieri TaxID=634 RepID=UPI001643D33E